MDYIQNIISEEIRNRRLFLSKYDEWKREQNSLTEEQATQIFEYFENIKNNLTPDMPPVARFLLKFNGVHGPMFREERLKDIAAYSFKQIMFLLNQYRTEEEGFNLEQEDNSDFGKLTSRATPENIEKSKALWYGDKHKVIDEETLRVYYIPDQKTSVQFGYYMEELNKQARINYSNIDNYARTWCIAVHNNNNLWSNYRDSRTFYFLIDDEKGDRDLYKLAAIQRDTSTDEKYRITNREYDNDPQMSWEELVRIYPKLEGHEDVFKPVRYDSHDELNASDSGTPTDIVQLMTENENSEYYIPRQDRQDIVRYIGRGFNFTKAHIWPLLDANLKRLYINKITRDNVYLKISNLEFLNAILHSDASLLSSRLYAVGINGLSEIRLRLMGGEFQMGRYNNVEHNGKVIYRHRNTNKFGIFDDSTGDWYKKDGITYEPNYNSSTPKLFKNVENPSDKFLIVTYFNGDSTKNFYCVIPMSGGNKNSGYLLSQKAFEKLEPNIVEGAFMHSIKKKPEDEKDIEEREI